MLTINLSALSPLLTAFLPVFVAFLAGVLRQDKFPQWLNEMLSYVVILALALVQVFLIGKLTGNAIADFALVAAYMTAILHTSYGQQLQQAVQTNVLSLGKAPPAPSPYPSAEDIAAVVLQQLAAMYPPQQSAIRVDQMQTQSVPAITRASTPQQGG